MSDSPDREAARRRLANHLAGWLVVAAEAVFFTAIFSAAVVARTADAAGRTAYFTLLIAGLGTAVLSLIVVTVIQTFIPKTCHGLRILWLAQGVIGVLILLAWLAL